MTSHLDSLEVHGVGGGQVFFVKNFSGTTAGNGFPPADQPGAMGMSEGMIKVVAAHHNSNPGCTDLI